jgi:DNA-binding NarL/FixJ family response regulator
MNQLDTQTGPTGEKARILLVDEDPLVLIGMARVINDQGDLVSCGEVSSSAATAGAAAEHRPDLAVIDLRMQGGDGLEFIKSLSARFMRLRILVRSQFNELLYAERVVRAGGHGYLTKGQPITELLQAVRTVLAGEIYLSRAMTNILLQNTLLTQSHAAGVEKLTDRELQVLMSLGSGMSTRLVAQEMCLSVKTVETHREHIKQKLRLAGASELIHFATHWVNNHCLSGGNAPKSAARPASAYLRILTPVDEGAENLRAL